MSGVLGYVLGYDAGRSDADVSRQRREIVDKVFYGRHLCKSISPTSISFID